MAALAENLPHRSRENEFTDGRVIFRFVFRREALLNAEFCREVLCGASAEFSVEARSEKNL